MRTSGYVWFGALVTALAFVGSDREGASRGLPVPADDSAFRVPEHLRLPGMTGFPSDRNRVRTCYARGTPVEYIREFERTHFGGGLSYEANGRWSSTASNSSTGSSGTPITLTYSFVPDGAGNVIHAKFDSVFGSRALWTGLIRQAFDAWSTQSGLTFLETTDDGVDGPGLIGQRGDIRMHATTVDGPGGVLAYAFFPDNGDVYFDQDEDWANATGNYHDFRDTLSHEVGHAFGLDHVSPENETKLMEPFASTAFEGPQDDDIRAANFLYGDPSEPNDDHSDATALGPFSAGAHFSEFAIRANDDWFSSSASGAQSVTVRLVPVGSQYQIGAQGGATHSINTASIRALRLDVYDASGDGLLRTVSGAPGQTLTTVPVSPAGPFFVRVKGADSGSDVQRYELFFTSAGSPLRTLSVGAQGAAAVAITASPADGKGTVDLVAPGQLVYSNGQLVTLTAPDEGSGTRFIQWVVDGVAQQQGVKAIPISMNADHSAVAFFADAPIVDAGADQSIVKGDAVQLSANVTGGAPPYTYEWTPATGLSSPNSATTTASPTSPTTYTIKVTDITNVFVVDTVTVNVMPSLRATASGGQVGVKGRTFKLTGAATGGIAPYTFAWTPAADLLDPQSATPTGTFTSSIIYTVTATDSAGHTAKATVGVGVAAAVTVDLGADQTIKGGATTTLQAKVTGGIPPFSYSWEPPGVLTAEGNNASVKPEGPVTCRVAVTDSLGQQGSDEVNVLIASGVQVSATAEPANIAAGESTLLRGSVSGGVPPYTYAWAPIVNMTAPTADQTQVSPLVTTNYGVTVLDSLGQTGSASVRVEVGEEFRGGAAASSTSDADLDSPAPSGACGAAPLLVMALMVASVNPIKRYAGVRRR